MKIYKARLAFSGGNEGTVYTMDVIQHEGSFWLVPEWRDSHAERVSMPVRMILLDLIQHTRLSGNPDFLLTETVPIEVIEGRPTQEQAKQYVVRENPAVQVPWLN